jgi:hypothetical protein
LYFMQLFPNDASGLYVVENHWKFQFFSIGCKRRFMDGWQL